MIEIKNKHDCCGCGLCAASCPKNAIKMIKDSLGFLYPEVNKESCIGCSLCERVCIMKHKLDSSKTVLNSYASRCSNCMELQQSQSGGVFYAISEKILKKDGVIYGASFDEHFNVKHARATKKKERDDMRLSKYVQSDLSNVYAQIKGDLESGKVVFFTGTPCQVAAIRKYIGQRFSENLYTLDIFCHGVPSPQIWRDNLDQIERKYRSKIVKAKFRDKQLGWNFCRETYELENGKKIIRNSSNYLYFQHFTIRESCSCCPFACLHRIGDVSTGDFWGHENFTNNYQDNKGVSVTLINTEKGEKLFADASSLLDIIPVPLEKVMQPQLIRPVDLHQNRDSFISDYETKGFGYVARKYGDQGMRYIIKCFIDYLKSIRLIRKIFRKPLI